MSAPRQSLNEAQRAAVEHGDGPLLVLAGPGSGKTRVVTQRIAAMIARGVDPRRILALTFTNKAADEMKRRVQAEAPGCPVWVSTFHRFGVRMLRDYAELVGLRPNFTIYDTDDARQTLRRAVEAERIPLGKVSIDRIAQGISHAKNRLILPDEYQARRGSLVAEVVAAAYPAYQRRLLDSSAVDFDDLLMHVALLLRDNPELRAELDARFQYVLVDEYQDTNRAQYQILRALCIDCPNVTATGDPDQSIYGWRGADINNILQFEADFRGASVVRLEQNYRSTPNILTVADQLIGHNVRRKRKTLFTDRAPGQPVKVVQLADEKAEAQHIVADIRRQLQAGRRPSDFAVFYRMNALSRTLEHEFRRAGLPFQLVRGVEFLQRREVRDVLAYCQVLNNPRDETALLRIINTPPRGIGRKTLELLARYADAQRCTLLEACGQATRVPGLGARAVKALEKFAALMTGLAQATHASVSDLLRAVIEQSGYDEYLRLEDTEEDASRLANVQELLTDASQFDEDFGADASLEQYLEKTWLVNDVDDWEGDADKVTLMTLHAAKGLEFPVVYIVAVEHGILPHERSSREDDQLEEERRLLFVGLTRAQDQLQLTFTVRREFRGRRVVAIPSSFLLEIPRDAVEVEQASRSPRTASAPWDEFDSSDPFDAADGFAQVDEFAEFDEFAQAPAAAQRDGFDQSSPWDVAEDAGDAHDAHDAPLAQDAAAPQPPAALPITTAAQLAGIGSPAPAPSAVDPDLFAEGMLVAHPEHGPGKIVRLAGHGPRRQATVRFAAAGERKFILAFSALRPVDLG